MRSARPSITPSRPARSIIAEAPVDERTRDQWLDRLWEAYQNDEIPYIERLGDCWGELCASRERASAWADRLIGTVESVWSPARKPGGYFHGTIACLSALFRAGRYEELLALVDRAPYSMWHYRAWGVKALAAMGRKAEAIRYAEASRGLNDNPIAIARACEEILLTSGLADEAYARYAIEANQRTTFVATFRSIEKKYPTKAAGEDPRRSGRKHARAGGQVVRRGEGCGALRRSDGTGPANALRSAHPDEGGPRLRGDESPVCRRGGHGRAAMDRRRLRLRDHGAGRAVSLFEHHGRGEERQCRRRDESRIRELLCAPKSPSKEFVANALERGLDVR